MSENHGTIWVCIDCTMHHANGECISCHDDHGHDKEPLSAIEAPYSATAGMLREEHAEGCEPDDECDCEVNTFSRSQCEGCGSRLHGERHAMTLWKN